ncbi:hypothetical protein PHLCEN_2v2975 [Hermanssonia centrifuga]|uniref:Uncharacterized protein n=1 Tax=Hermanssonia centrifuga TaxID=98765 RepID=A0A2R6REN5_9APHY|nr:hypothetical protein PHLCEN_2v2975 [Hermanssonia centrifuga]
MSLSRKLTSGRPLECSEIDNSSARLGLRRSPSWNAKEWMQDVCGLIPILAASVGSIGRLVSLEGPRTVGIDEKKAAK